MASTKIELVYTWENDINFRATRQEGAEEKVTILDIDENGAIHEIWGYIAGIINNNHAAILNRIKTEMGVP